MNPNEMNVVKVSSTNRVKYLTSWAHAWQNKNMLNILCAFMIENDIANIFQTYFSKRFSSVHLKESHILTSVLASIAARTRRNKHDQMPTHPYTGRNGTMAWVAT